MITAPRMSLDSFALSANEKSEDTDKAPSLPRLLVSSAYYELHQSAYGLAQTVGLQKHVGEMEQPVESDSWLGRQFQMVGRGVGGFLPTAAVAAVTRYGFGRVLEHVPTPADNLLLKRSAIGLSTAESVVTGLASGAIFKPTDEATAQNRQGFAEDRAKSALSSGLAFGTMTMATFGWNKLASTQVFENARLAGFLKSAPITGLATGTLGGITNAESSSLITNGTLTVDGGTIAKSAYEMSVIGGCSEPHQLC